MYFRLAPLSIWLENKDRFFFDNEQIPLLVTVDGYFYLDIAKSLQEDTYQRHDQRRHVPVGHNRQATPPLLSYMLAHISSFSGVSLEWIALLLPPILGCLLAVPTYILGYLLAMRARSSLIDEEKRKTTARFMGLTAAFFTMLSPMYMERSAAGWFDTDVMNVTFPLILAILGIKLADSRRMADLSLFAAIFSITILLFLWWWDQTYIPVIGFTVFPLLAALLIQGFSSPRKIIHTCLLIIPLIIAVWWWKGISILDPRHFLDLSSKILHYIGSQTGDSPFRPAGIAVSEQNVAELSMIVRKSAGWWPAFLLSCVGLLLLMILTRWYFLFLGALLLVTFLSFQGVRFLIFSAPLFGLGIGTLVFFISHGTRKKVLQYGIVIGVFLLGSWGVVQASKFLDRRVPRRLPVLFEAMKIIKEKTPENAVVWASWGHGHPMIFYSQRGVVADGIYHSDELQYILNFPFATPDFRLAANWMSFYVEHGPKGLRKASQIFNKSNDDWILGLPILQKMLSLGVTECGKHLSSEYKFDTEEVNNTLSFLFPGNPRPIYLFLDYLLADQAWYELGRWDVVNGAKPARYTYLTLRDVKVTPDKKVIARSRNTKLTIDAREGTVQVGQMTAPLQSLNVYNGRRMSRKQFNERSGYIANLFLPGRVGVVASSDVADTLFSKMYFEATYNKSYVRPVNVKVPYYSIWQVFGEEYQK